MSPKCLALVATTIILIFLNAQKVKGFSVSVPPVRSVCKTMIPNHDRTKPQQSESPFNVSTDVKSVKGGEIVEITLFAKEGRAFIGFYLQSRDSNGSPIGMFNPNDSAKAHSCGGIKNNAAHHVNSEKKDKIRISWKSPKNYRGTVQIQATMVENYITFWSPIKANVIIVT